MDFQEIVGRRIDFWERRRAKEKMTVKDLIEASCFGLVQKSEKFWKSEFENVKSNCESESSDFAQDDKRGNTQDDAIEEAPETQFAKSPLLYKVEKLEDCHGFEFGYKVKSEAKKRECDFWIELKYGVRQANCILIELCIDSEKAKFDRAEIGFITDEDKKYLVKFCDHVFRDFDEIMERVPLG